MESVFDNFSDEGSLYSPYSSEQDSEDCDYDINPEYESNDDLDDPLGPDLVAPKDSASELSISEPPSVSASASASTTSLLLQSLPIRPGNTSLLLQPLPIRPSDTTSSRSVSPSLSIPID
jgi:hypothetical protein